MRIFKINIASQQKILRLVVSTYKIDAHTTARLDFPYLESALGPDCSGFHAERDEVQSGVENCGFVLEMNGLTDTLLVVSSVCAIKHQTTVCTFVCDCLRLDYVD